MDMHSRRIIQVIYSQAIRTIEQRGVNLMGLPPIFRYISMANADYDSISCVNTGYDSISHENAGRKNDVMQRLMLIYE